MACRMEMMSRGPTPSAFSPSTRYCRDTPSCTTAILLPLPSSIWMLVRGTSCVVPVLEKGDGDGGDAHIRAHHDHAAVFVDHHPRGFIGIDLDLLDVGEQRHHAARIVGGNSDLD